MQLNKLSETKAFHIGLCSLQDCACQQKADASISQHQGKHCDWLERWCLVRWKKDNRKELGGIAWRNIGATDWNGSVGNGTKREHQFREQWDSRMDMHEPASDMLCNKTIGHGNDFREGE